MLQTHGQPDLGIVRKVAQAEMSREEERATAHQVEEGSKQVVVEDLKRKKTNYELISSRAIFCTPLLHINYFSLKYI